MRCVPTIACPVRRPNERDSSEIAARGARAVEPNWSRGASAARGHGRPRTGPLVAQGGRADVPWPWVGPRRATHGAKPNRKAVYIQHLSTTSRAESRSLTDESVAPGAADPRAAAPGRRGRGRTNRDTARTVRIKVKAKEPKLEESLISATLSMKSLYPRNIRALPMLKIIKTSTCSFPFPRRERDLACAVGSTEDGHHTNESKRCTLVDVDSLPGFTSGG